MIDTFLALDALGGSSAKDTPPERALPRALPLASVAAAIDSGFAGFTCERDADPRLVYGEPEHRQVYADDDSSGATLAVASA